MWDRPALMNAVANALFAIAALLVLAAAAVHVARLPEFALREVRVGGELKHVTREQVEDVVRRERGARRFAARGGVIRHGSAASIGASPRSPPRDTNPQPRSLTSPRRSI